MQFDRLAEASEKHFPKWRKAVQDARLFVLDESRPNPIQSEKDALQTWEPDEQVVENFRLPFDTVAIESRGCVVLSTVDASKRQYNAMGISGWERDALCFAARLTAFPGGEFVADAKRYGKECLVENMEVFNITRSKVDEVQFSMGEISLRKSDRDEAMGGVSVDYLPAGTNTGTRIKLHGQTLDTNDVLANPSKYRSQLDEMKSMLPQLMAGMEIAQANVAYTQLVCAVWLALRIMEPSTFVIEHTHIDFKPREPKAGKVIRSPYRPHYIVLTPGEIRRRFIRDDDGESIPSGMTRRPHERRGHFRKLTSERFVSKKGHVLWIKPCWVGKTEGVVGKNRYVVRLDI